IVRLVFVVFALLKGAGILLYLIAAIVIPSQDYNDEDIDNMKSANFNDKESSENQSSSTQESNKIHTDEEFDSYFKK
ncbi:MAG: PspC domain-containing protein, partial [Spirochaetia bacterium]|nr:PspC domain-containing protein [Spirochaetia bacterium]